LATEQKVGYCQRNRKFGIANITEIEENYFRSLISQVETYSVVYARKSH
jgi:hypothetical protein